MEIQCVLYRIDPIESYGERFKKRFVYVKYQDQRNRIQYLKFQLSQERVDMIDGYEPGNEIKIQFSLEGREVDNSKGEKTIYDSKEVYYIESAEIEVNTSASEENDGGVLAEGEPDIDLPF